MKTILFLITLFAFASCIDPLNKESFAQLNSTPAAKSIFAAMSMNMKGGAGFEEILGLLSDLVDESANNRFENRQTYEPIEKGCDISAFEAETKKAFYEGNIKIATEWVQHTKEQADLADELLKSRKESTTGWATVEKDCNENRNSATGYLTHVYENFADAISAGEELRDTLSNETTVDGAFLQSKVKKFTNSYKNAKNLDISLPNNFVQKAVTVDVVRERLLSWVIDVLTGLYAEEGNYKSFADFFNKKGGEAIANCNRMGELATLLKSSAATLQGAHAHVDKVLGEYQKGLENIEKLSTLNGEAAESGAKWCKVEKDNFTQADEDTTKTIAIFKKVRSFFIHHYNELSDLVKSEYHN